jgi:hypothetical protein
MPKTVKGVGGGKRHPLNMRTTAETRERLEASAAASGRSLAQEVEYRLEQSFSWEEVVERAFGGPDVRRIVELVITGFNYSGRAMAHAKGHPDWTPAEWMRDPECYRAAAEGVVEALVMAEPDADWERSWEEIDLVCDSIKSKIGAILVRQGKLEYHFKKEEVDVDPKA